MPTRKPPTTELQRAGRKRAERIRRELSEAVRTSREDAGMSLRALARAAGVGFGAMHSLEHDRREPSLEVLARVAAVLGGRLVAYIQAGTGPLVRDHLQAAMLSALAETLSDGWKMRLEVPVHEPVSGVIDAVLDRLDGSMAVASEAHSQLRRIEQQVRWATAKADALAGVSESGEPIRVVSRLLLVRSTAANRAVVAQYPDLLRAAYPARCVDALEALAGSAPWPGASMLWCRVDAGGAELLPSPPRGIRLGR